jgi:hypothetical protein
MSLIITFIENFFHLIYENLKITLHMIPRYFSLFSWCISLFFLLNSCKKDDNTAPVIHVITFAPSSATPGSTVQVTAIVTDVEKDPINYSWTTDDGQISDPTSPLAYWILSSDASVNSMATIRLTVTDGKEMAEKDQKINIVAGVEVKGTVYYAGTSIPVSGVTLRMGEIITTSTIDGKFAFSDIPKGINTIAATKEGFDSFGKNIDFKYSTNTYNIEMTSSTETKQLYGTVKTIIGESLFGIRVTILNPDSTESRLTDITDFDGNYQIAAVPQGTRMLKLTNEANANECKPVIHEVYVANLDKNYDPGMKILRSFEIISKTTQWTYNESQPKVVWDGTAWNLKGGSNNYSIKSSIIVPPEAEDVKVKIRHMFIGYVHYDNNYPLSEDNLFMISLLSTNKIYSWYWMGIISRFRTDIITNDSFIGNELAFTFWLVDYEDIWKIENLTVSYYY